MPRLDVPFEAYADWWIPGEEDNKVVGQFNFEPRQSLQLRLYRREAGQSAFGNLTPFRSRMFPVLLGHSLRHGDITLYDCFWRKYDPDSSGALLHVTRAAIGGHAAIDDRCVKGIVMMMGNLSAWAGGASYSFEHEEIDATWHFSTRGQPAGPNMAEPNIPCEGRLENSGSNLKVYNSLWCSRENDTVKIWPNAQIHIDFDSLQTADDARQIAADMEFLVQLLMGCVSLTTMIRVKLTTGLDASILEDRWTNLVDKELHSQDVLCPVDAHGFDFVATADWWLANAERFRSVLSLLHAVLMKANTHLEAEIVQIMQAIEAYCCETNNFTYLSEHEFEHLQTLLKGQLGNISCPDFRTKAKNAFKYLNRPSQSSHLTRLLRSLETELVGRIIKGKKTPFIRRAVDCRNTIIHPQNGSVWKMVSKSQAVLLISQLKAILIAALLRDAGVPDEVLRRKYTWPGQWQWG